MRVAVGTIVLLLLMGSRVDAQALVDDGGPVLIEGGFKELPFHRILNLQLTAGIIVDGLGLCVEANPSIFFAVEGCADSIFVYSSLLANVKSRFLHYQNITETRLGSLVSHRGYTLALGPSIGVRKLWWRRVSCPQNGCVGEPALVGLDLMLSAEWVYWFSRFLGLALRLDAGEFISGSASSPLPAVRFSFGVAL